MKSLVKNVYQDSLLWASEDVIQNQDSAITSLKIQQHILRTVIDNDNVQIDNLNTLNDTLTRDLNKSQAKAARMKKFRWVYFGVGFVSASGLCYLLAR